MIQKLFPLDKNYILRQAQSQLEDEMLDLMVYELRKSYTQLYNPLMLMDKTFEKILDTYEYPLDRLRMIYWQLCGIYRYKNRDNQLEILFDGRTHLEKFKDDWTAQMQLWCRELGQHEPYVKTMLRMTLLYDGEGRAEWSENHCKAFINQHFELKIVKRKGELKLKLA
ncbi:hypothetical protein [Mongoliitalea daihaiensis]|uniref:hypothetical protein n=1 Tax=Mongoliitalea daihaiensis TaxID=2782006 RepID=UPI001F1F8CFA|nr:hypothetical protein [Mongoliitalea daihaiensis]UJP65675.1 hypothetical protein IPZ59_03345 [Mongoliitalea daihaiensis]